MPASFSTPKARLIPDGTLLNQPSSSLDTPLQVVACFPCALCPCRLRLNAVELLIANRHHVSVGHVQAAIGSLGLSLCTDLGSGPFSWLTLCTCQEQNVLL